MRIGVFFESMPKEIGGGFTFQETVVRGLGERRGSHEFVLFHYGPQPALAGQTQLHFHSLGGARSLKRALRNAMAPLRFLQFKRNRAKGCSSPLLPQSPLDAAARSEGVDLMWFPTPSAEKVSCPFVMTIWDLEHRAQPYFPEVSAHGEWEAREKYYGQLLPQAAYVITGTQVGAGEIQRFYGVAPERIRQLPHPTPDFALASERIPAQKRPASLPPGDFVLYPAQFWAHKNHITLVRAIAALKARGVSIRLALVGSDKGNRAHVAELAQRLGVSDHVHFLGFVSREELVYLYQNALALTYPSLCGPENLPPLEAFALGCPVIAADIPGAREQLGSAAQLVPALNETAWADVILEWQRSPAARAAMIDPGRARALAYTGSHFLGDLQGIFTEYAAVRALWGSYTP